MFHAILSNAQQSAWWQSIKLTHARWAEVDGDQRAAAFAYYLLLSILPLAFILVSLGSLFVERQVASREIVQWVNHFIPLTSEQSGQAETTILDILESSGKLSFAVFPLLVWSAMKFLRTLVRSANRIWLSPPYNWWRLPLKSLGLLGITASAVLFGVLVPVFARLIRDWLTIHLSFPQWAFSLLFQIIPWLVMFYGLLMIYRLAPSRPTKFSDVWVGALGATVLIWASERLFMIYATHFASFNALYGALGGILAFLLWLYISSSVGLLGICFCAARSEMKSNQAGTMP